MRKIVVTFAVESEFASWRRASHFERVTSGAAPIYLMRNRRTEVYACVTGVGMRGIGSELAKLLANSTDLCIASGLAGGLRSEYPAGSIVVGRAVKSNATDRQIKSDETLVELARECGASSVDLFLTSDVIVSASSEKKHLAKIAGAVDMESLHVLQQAKQCGVPAVAIRAISDSAETDLPMDFNTVIDSQGRIEWLPALHAAVKVPTRLPSLIRFGLVSSRAARHLGKFLDRYVNLLIGAGDMQFSPARAMTR